MKQCAQARHQKWHTLMDMTTTMIGATALLEQDSSLAS